MRLRPRPEFFALLAAMANGTIGSFNRFGFAAGATHNQIAFLKCCGAFLLLSALCLSQPELRERLVLLRHRARHFALLAFLGVFCLYFFETWAFAEAAIPLVSFLTYAAGGGTLVLSSLILKEKVTLAKLIAFCLILAGVGLLYSHEGHMTGSRLGIILALLGGLGYALFIFSAKLFTIGSGLPHLVWLFGFGSLYLSAPWVYYGFALPPLSAIWPVVALVILPTIGGFWLTTKAIMGGNAGSVQVIETSDPLFASLMAFLLFGDTLSLVGSLGAALIMAGLLCALYKPS
ncbi:MAG: DMT family transporter [Hyphomicrobiales bacterium]